MPQLSPLEHSLLRSGFQVVDQNADILALPKDYKPQLPAAVANLRSAAAKTPSSDYVSVGDNTIYTGGEDTLTALRFYFTDKECYNLVGMQIGYPNNVWTKIMGKETQYTENWNRQDGEKITFTSTLSLTGDGRVTRVRLNSSTRGPSNFGLNGNSVVTTTYDANFPPLVDLQAYYNSECIIWLQYIGKYTKQANNNGGGGTGNLTLVPRPSSMRLEEQLAREVTGDIESDNWEKLFDAKVAAGEDVSKALTRLEEKDEASAWTKYYNRTKKQTVYVCSQSGGQIYIWTRDVGTTDAPEHVTQIGYKGAALLVATEWSLTGTFSKNDVTQTTLAYKSWFTKYVKDSTGEIKNKSDQALRDALAGAGVIAKTGVLKVYYSGAPLATGANIINSFTCGVWAILACEKFVKGLVPKPYLVVDTLNFDQKSDWVKLLVEGTDDVFLGAEGGTDVIPKPGGYVYPHTDEATANEVTVFLKINIFLESCTTRRAWASLDKDNKLLAVFGYVATANSNETASVGITVLQTDQPQAQSELSILKAVSEVGSTSEPSAIAAVRQTDEENALQKVSVLIGKYA